MNFEERVIIYEFHLNDTDDQVIQYIRHNKNQTVDNQMIVDSLFLYHRGCGQILGPCYFKLVPDFACTP